MGLEAMDRMEPRCETSSWIIRNSTPEKASKFRTKVYGQQLYSPQVHHENFIDTVFTL